ncbi:MAG: HAD family hydrolase [Enterococcus sp.]|nr:HAD family hydrolase [Enterococcus sp.]
MYKTILLDIDGTILDSEKVLLSALQESIRDTIGLKTNFKDLEVTIGMREEEVSRLFTDNTFEQKKIITQWSNNIKNTKNRAQLFPHVESTLFNLKKNGVELGIVTSKTDLHMENDFNYLGINKYFSVIVTSDNVINPKPHPEPLELAIKKIETNKNETLYVGDSIFDFYCAKNAGVDFALATWGAKDDDKLYNNSIILNDFKDILDFAYKI